jgi:hypothetical protein
MILTIDRFNQNIQIKEEAFKPMSEIVSQCVAVLKTTQPAVGQISTISIIMKVDSKSRILSIVMIVALTKEAHKKSLRDKVQVHRFTRR